MNEPTQQTAEIGHIISHEYDAIPRDGPAVFVALRRALDIGAGLAGAWIDTDQTPDAIAAGIEEVTGRAWQLGGWAIVDQVGLGQVAVDEDCPPRELGRLAGRVVSQESPS
jgi:hypothetical protein